MTFLVPKEEDKNKQWKVEPLAKAFPHFEKVRTLSLSGTLECYRTEPDGELRGWSVRFDSVERTLFTHATLFEKLVLSEDRSEQVELMLRCGPMRTEVGWRRIDPTTGEALSWITYGNLDGTPLEFNRFAELQNQPIPKSRRI